MKNLYVEELDYKNIKLQEYVAELKERYKINNKVLLIQTPQFLFESFNIDVAKNRGYYAFPPTGLQTIAKSISSFDLEVNLLDLNYELLNRIVYDGFDINQWLSIFDDYINKFDPSVIGITCLTEYNEVLNTNHPLTALLNNIRKKYNKIVIIGGPTPTNEYSNYLEKNLCDFVITNFLKILYSHVS